MTESYVRIDPQVERLTEGVHGIPPVAFIFRPAPGTKPSRDAVGDVLDQTFAGMGWADWREDPPWVAYPRIEVAPGGHLLVFEYVEDHQAFRAFLRTLVILMERAGMSGALLPPPGVRLPIRVPYAPAECLTAGLALNIDLDKVKALPQAAANIGWHVPPALTSRVIDRVLAWLGAVQDATWSYYSGSREFTIQSTEARDLISATFSERPATALTAATPHEFRRVQFSVFGHVTFEIGSVDDDWSADLANLVDLLTAGAGDARYGFIRRSVAPQRHWMNALWTYPPPPFVRQSYYRSPSDVESSYVPDVYGVQLLTRAHMAHLTDLSQWQTQELSPDRVLVGSPTPEDWFKADAPGPDVLSAARRDFQEAIMTREIVDWYT